MNTESKELTFNARQVLGILEQAEAGCHVLFDVDTIRRALQSVEPPDLDGDAVEHVQAAIETLSKLQRVEDVRAYIGSLPVPLQDVLVHLYFRFLDQFMQRRDPTWH